jgi:hypothetical protein
VIVNYELYTPIVLYECRREERGLRVFENRVLRRIFRPKRDEVTGGLRKLRNEELHNLYSSPDIIRMTKSRRMRSAAHVAYKGAKRNTYRILAEKPEGKKQLGRPGRRGWMILKLSWRNRVG